LSTLSDHCDQRSVHAPVIPHGRESGWFAASKYPMLAAIVLAGPTRQRWLLSKSKIDLGMFHENLRENIDSKTASPRSFGLTFAALFLVIGAAPLIRHGHVRAWSLVLGLIILTIALTQPRVLGPLNRFWSLIGSLLSRVTTPVLMAIVFVLVITPVALLRRMTGSSGLALRFDPKLESYWIRRDRTAVVDTESLKRQF
jgi:hypothetical protein